MFDTLISINVMALPYTETSGRDSYIFGRYYIFDFDPFSRQLRQGTTVDKRRYYGRTHIMNEATIFQLKYFKFT